MALDEDTDYENTSSDVSVLKEPDQKLDEKLLYLIGRVAVVRQLLEEDVPLGITTVKRLNRLKALVDELPVPVIEKPKRMGFGS